MFLKEELCSITLLKVEVRFRERDTQRVQYLDIKFSAADDIDDALLVLLGAGGYGEEVDGGDVGGQQQCGQRHTRHHDSGSPLLILHAATPWK